MSYFKVRTRNVRELLIALVVLPTSLLHQGCSTKNVEYHARETGKPSVKELNRIEAANPTRDLQDAIARSDFRFVGIWGYTVEVPGVNANDKRIEEQGVRIIEGTSDALTSDLAAKFQEKARTYAEQYNHLLIDYLKQQDAKRTNGAAPKK